MQSSRVHTAAQPWPCRHWEQEQGTWSSPGAGWHLRWAAKSKESVRVGAGERENEHSAEMAAETELSPRAMKPLGLSHSKQGTILSSAAPSCLGWAAASLTTLAAEKGCPDAGWDVAACLSGTAVAQTRFSSISEFSASSCSSCLCAAWVPQLCPHIFACDHQK